MTRPNGKGRPAQSDLSPRNTIRQAQDSQRRIVRVNIGKVSGTFRSGNPTDLEAAIRAVVPARSREQAIDAWVIHGSSTTTLLNRLRADGWIVIQWPSFYGGSA